MTRRLLMSKLGSLEYTLSKLCLLPTEQVHPHEATKLPEVFSIRESMNRVDPVLGERMSPIPIMVALIKLGGDEEEYVVLDGMHRYQAMKERGCPHVLAYLVDYDEEAELHGWNAIIVETFEVGEVLKKTELDFAVREEGEIASGKFRWENIDIPPEEAQDKVNNGEWAFAFVERTSDGYRAYYPDKDGEFSLEEKVQLLMDFDEAVETIFGGPQVFRFVADNVSIQDFQFLEAPYLLIRTRFSKEEVQRAAHRGFLLPKKTTRHIFKMRPFVQIPMRILDDRRMPADEKMKKAIQFIRITYRDRFYPESIHNFRDVVAPLDVSFKCPDLEIARRKKEEIESNPRLHFAKEWSVPDDRLVSLPGPVGFVDLEVTGGFWAGYVVGHRSPEFQDLYHKATDAIRWMLDPNGGEVYRNIEAYIIPAPASHSMAIAALSSVLPEHRILHIVAGAFGERWAEISRDYGQEVEKFYIEPGSPFTDEDAQELYEILKKGDFDAVTVVYNETSTGTYYDLRRAYRAINEAERDAGRDILFLVDAASAFGGMPIEGLENVDFLVLSVEKCLAIPPGFSILVVNKRGIAKAYEIEDKIGHPLGYTTSLTRIRRFHLKHQTLGTPPIPQIIMFLKAIQRIHGYVSLDSRYVPGEGLENRYNRYRRLAEMTGSWAKKLGFKLFPKEKDICSPTVTAVCTDPFDSDVIVEVLRQKDRIDLSAGHRDLKDRYGNRVKLLRIPHMGNMQEEDLRELLGRIEAILREMVEERYYNGLISRSEFMIWKKKLNEN
jgi:aspartate aminotransferase-like enzyme